ncbi:hypothetical protein CONPUDRAFT_130799 [Coniophora puteana RWD-64-598 SS2]|uniref:Uncharacterized protein n=1 Tax=Coniophora puteana (strain RWD-64-598) TaxID=741705 RepID=A0A5M3MAG2_CONPW|nr:uncharacterized protein CONPUDRAFT_130799 [Coniophora puteana RWD-64-598 SS2]EIW76272.1 hypothetical protein CONPUDRAFT_130799 [Coniophora puteana RWD-64-598 SS2]
MPPKRKSDAANGAAAKKARSAWAATAILAADIVGQPTDYPVPEDEGDVRKMLLELAQYALHLEQEAAAAAAAGSQAAASKALTPEQLAASVEKIRKAAGSGIKNQMKWRPSCKGGGAKWSYDGVCVDPNVFGALLGLEGPPKWKMHKMPIEEFENRFGCIEGSARYSHLWLNGKHVNIRWAADEGTFKLSGTYGDTR